jgi:hypothetical protein
LLLHMLVCSFTLCLREEEQHPLHYFFIRGAWSGGWSCCYRGVPKL